MLQKKKIWNFKTKKTFFDVSAEFPSHFKETNILKVLLFFNIKIKNKIFLIFFTKVSAIYLLCFSNHLLYLCVKKLISWNIEIKGGRKLKSILFFVAIYRFYNQNYNRVRERKLITLITFFFIWLIPQP